MPDMIALRSSVKRGQLEDSHKAVRLLCKEGRLMEALHLLQEQNLQDFQVYSDICITILKGCIQIKAVEEGKQVHAQITRKMIEPDGFLGTALVNMYVKCGHIEDACQVFDCMAAHNVFMWTTIISGYVQHGNGKEALRLFHQMKQEGTTPDRVTFLNTLSGCACIAALEQGKWLHADVVKARCDSDIFVSSTLVDMYAKCGSLDDASHVFGRMSVRDVISWNTMLTGYAQLSCGEETLFLFRQMQEDGLKPSKVTFTNLLGACTSIESFSHGKHVHSNIMKTMLDWDYITSNLIMDMYAKCGSICNAVGVFERMQMHDVTTWNTLIAGMLVHGDGKGALKLYEEMRQGHKRPDKVTFVSILTACAEEEVLHHGKKIHSDALKAGHDVDVFVGSALVNMYCKCITVDAACQVFNRMHVRNLVSWNAMLAGYAHHGNVLKLLTQMHEEGFHPNKVTFIGIFSSYASIAALEQGKYLHLNVLSSEFEADIVLSNTLIDMYSKSGSIGDARAKFESMQSRTIVSWNAILAGYTQHGDVKEVMQLFSRMQQEGLWPNDISFVCFLSLCGHACLVDEGCHYFHLMSQYVGSSQKTQHYACIVDLLGRAGYAGEAEEFLATMPLEPTSIMWMSLLGACRVHGNGAVAQRAIVHLIDLEPWNASTFVLLSNVCAEGVRWTEISKVTDKLLARFMTGAECTVLDASLVEDLESSGPVE